MPQVGVEGSVNAVVGGLHHLGDELLDLLDGEGGTLVEGALLQDLGEVDGQLVGDVISLAALALAQGGAGGATDAGVLGRVADASELLLLVLAHLGEHALPALVILGAASLDLLLAVSDEGELLLLAQDLSLHASANHLIGPLVKVS